MTAVAVAAHRSEIRDRVVSPYIGRLHSRVAVLTVRDRIPRQALHILHFSKPAAWVFNKEIFGFKLAYELQNVPIYLVAEFGVIADRVKAFRYGIFNSVTAYCRY